LWPPRRARLRGGALHGRAAARRARRDRAGGRADQAALLLYTIVRSCYALVGCSLLIDIIVATGSRHGSDQAGRSRIVTIRPHATSKRSDYNSIPTPTPSGSGRISARSRSRWTGSRVVNRWRRRRGEPTRVVQEGPAVQAGNLGL